ncbi:MAG TPA: ATP-dependent metallopeptidase FtsH/Yme1/Tma family protein, partial [Acidimicrobiia bacterium]|nr:ATP-dependent metallopeptidase FtsH/Yme1/Tma family protein [Acidimicrobiia bacterium]
MATPSEPKPPVRPDHRADGRGDGARDRPPWRVENPRQGSRLGRMTDQRGRPRPSFWTLVIILLLVNWVASSFFLREEARADIPYTVFRAQVEAGNVSEITSIDDAIEGRFKTEVTYPPGDEGEAVRLFDTQRPAFAEDDLFQLLAGKGVEVNAKSPPGPSFFERLLIGFGPTLLLIGLLFYMSRRIAGGMGGIGGIGKSKAQRYDPDAGKRVTFEDVAGIDDVEDEVAEIVDFLKNAERYRKLDR